MTSTAFIDTNYILRFLLNDNETQSPLAYDVFKAVEAGTITIETSATVVFEAVYVLTMIYRYDRQATSRLIGDLIAIKGIDLDQKAAILRAFDRWENTGALSFADCFHLELTALTDHQRILTFDRAMSNRIPGVERVESLPLSGQALDRRYP